MVQVKTYRLKPTTLIPNSPYDLIHYPGLLLSEVKQPHFNPSTIYDLFLSNDWSVRWIAQYGPTQPSHYHSAAHECMAVISGHSATIRFGVADTTPDKETNTHGAGHEEGGVEISAQLGDVFIIPAGVAHKTFDPRPGGAGYAFHDVNRVGVDGDARAFVAGVGLRGEFMMIGAYPRGDVWDFAVGGEHVERYGDVWGVARPERDPVLGDSVEGLCGLWRGGNGV